ncbi:hypothetical protein ILUMI_08368 [Ignelater luminosus]|uniref:Centriolar coiled-coil protein of 110 kDa n=1 Tax=Ignelater luminosus TaxID=2038154 RepID=A0A8K0D689_IGNLU|nr:hypothetical protein ILUMI_08368 [Ignelater luminosus]
MCKLVMSDCTVIEMVKKCDAFDKLLQGNGYVSCIKINGNPILPPLVTPEKRLELEDYKKRAIDLERRLKCQKDLKTFIDKLDSCNLQLGENITENTNSSFSRTLEHILSFGNDSQSHIDALNICDISKNDDQNELPSNDNKETDVPLNSKRKNWKSLNLTCNVFDVTEYSDRGIIVFNDCIEQTDPVDKLVASTVELDLSDICCINDEKKSETTLNREICQPKPRLRSNSYTLDSPSPILLEHFKKQAKKDLNNSFMFEKQLVAPKRRSLDLGSSVSNKSFDDFRCKAFTSESVVSKECVLDHNASMSSGIVADISSIRDECDDNTLSGCDLTSVQKAVEDLAEKHFGTVREPKKTDVLDNNKLLSFDMTKGITDLSCLDSSNLELQDLPENYVKDIMEFLERYKNEQDMKLKLLREELNKSIGNNDRKEIQEQQAKNNNEIERSDGAVKLLCCENVIDASPVESSNPLNTSTPLLIDFESDSFDNEPVIYYDSNSSFTNSESTHTLSHYEYQNSQRNLSSANCSRELFPEDPKKLQKKLKEQWAATILTAAAKGYLIRRLKRTERVKNLIQTIQEALLCAMSLHTENSENIRPPDVELHRRLIQQVSAACYEFYEIFFNLTTKEQMALIAIDRQRLQEKLKRPKSVGSVKLNSSRSSTKSQQNSFNMRERKGLMPSYAA